MKPNLKYLLPALVAFSAFKAAAVEIPASYYESLDGLNGAELKNAIHRLVTTDVSMLSYGSGSNHTWWGFYMTDRNEDDNSVTDRYSNDVRYFTTQGSAISGMNIEHSFPKSWWGGSSNNAYKDLFNLMPCEATINSAKSNYPMGVVTTVTRDNGCTKVGRDEDSRQMWEPGDQWKGDFARTYMYMATAYQDFTWSGTQALQILEQNEYPTLQQWATDLYIEWAKNDPVAEIEVTRNGVVASIQGARNPYVDFPNLMCYVWGDSVNVAFNIATTVKAVTLTGLPESGDTYENVELYASTFLDDDNGGCTVANAIKPAALSEVWKNNATYGWTAKASTGSGTSLANYEADASLLTPEIDLTDCVSATLAFDHACKYAAAPSEVLQVKIRDTATGNEDVLDSLKWPAGTNWTYVNNSGVDLSPYVGKKIKVVFRYTSTTEEACTWEIKNLTVKGVKKTGDPQPSLKGDVNGDGSVDAVDLALMIDVILGNQPSGVDEAAADVDGDGDVDSTDIAHAILMMLS